MSNVKTTVQSNQITLSRSNFTVPQRRILHAIIETLSPYLRADLNFQKGKEIGFQPGLDDLCKIVYKASDLSSPDHYGEIRTALLQLEDKKYFLETEDFELRTRLILQSRFNKRDEYIELIINKELYETILDLSKGYTLYQTKVALSFSSIYAIKMYELVAKWRNEPKFFIDFDELRRLTDTQQKYLKSNDFKKNVLDIAQKQLNELDITDLKFTYKEKKRGKRIIGFDIYVIKTTLSHEIQDIKNKFPVSLKWDFGKDLIENFKKYDITIKGKNLELVISLKHEMGEENLALEIERIAEFAKEKNNKAGYIIKSLQKILLESKKEPAEMSPVERKQHAEKIRATETKRTPTKIGDLTMSIFENR